MTAPVEPSDAVAEPGATMTVDLPEAIDDAILAALRAARAFGAASELATAAEAHGLDGGPFWASEVRASEAVDTARFALRQAIADALAAAEHRRLAEAGARVAATARRMIAEHDALSVLPAVAWIADVLAVRDRLTGADRDVLTRTAERLRILAADLARVTAERDAAEARGRAEALGPIVSPAAMMRVAKDEADAARIAYVGGTGGEHDMGMKESRVTFRGLLLLDAAERALAAAALTPTDGGAP